MRPVGRILVAALLVACTATAVADVPGTATALRKASILVAKGERALQLGDTGEAERSFSRALEALVDLPEGHLGLGRVLLQQRRFPEAYQAFLAAERSFVQKNASLHQLQKKRYAKAQADLTGHYRRIDLIKANIDAYESASSSGSDRRIKRQVAEIRVLRDDVRRIDREIRRLEALPRPAPDTDGVPGQVYFFLGNALLHLGRMEEAVSAWQAAARIDPESALVQNNLAVACWRLGRLDEAQLHLEQAERLGFPINPQFRADLERTMAESANSPPSGIDRKP